MGAHARTHTHTHTQTCTRGVSPCRFHVGCKRSKRLSPRDSFSRVSTLNGFVLSMRLPTLPCPAQEEGCQP